MKVGRGPDAKVSSNRDGHRNDASGRRDVRVVRRASSEPCLVPEILEAAEEDTPVEREREPRVESPNQSRAAGWLAIIRYLEMRRRWEVAEYGDADSDIDQAECYPWLGRPSAGSHSDDTPAGTDGCVTPVTALSRNNSYRAPAKDLHGHDRCVVAGVVAVSLGSSCTDTNT